MATEEELTVKTHSSSVISGQFLNEQWTIEVGVGLSEIQGKKTMTNDGGSKDITTDF